jgi:hypothetical protein
MHPPGLSALAAQLEIACAQFQPFGAALDRFLFFFRRLHRH